MLVSADGAAGLLAHPEQPESRDTRRRRMPSGNTRSSIASTPDRQLLGISTYAA
jgi:hypothetical protein